MDSVLFCLCPQMQLTEKEMIRMEIQGLLDQFYTKPSQKMPNGNTNRLSFFILLFCHLLSYKILDHPWLMA